MTDKCALENLSFIRYLALQGRLALVVAPTVLFPTLWTLYIMRGVRHSRISSIFYDRRALRQLTLLCRAVVALMKATHAASTLLLLVRRRQQHEGGRGRRNTAPTKYCNADMTRTTVQPFAALLALWPFVTIFTYTQIASTTAAGSDRGRQARVGLYCGGGLRACPRGVSTYE